LRLPLYHNKSRTHDAIKGLVCAVVRKCNYDRILLVARQRDDISSRGHWPKMDLRRTKKVLLSVASNGTF
jgi:ribosomal protein L22